MNTMSHTLAYVTHSMAVGLALVKDSRLVDHLVAAGLVSVLAGDHIAEHIVVFVAV